MSRLAAFLNRNRAGALTVSAGLSAAMYVAACMLPGEPAERIEFTLDSVMPYRVPLAGVREPLITISADGQVLKNPSYRLETLDSGVVRVDATERRLLGVMRGTAAVRVTYFGATGTPDTVFPVQVVISRIAVDLHALAFTQLGVRTRLTAIALNANSAAVPNVPFTWSSADTTVAVVNDTGLVTAVYEGATTITAEADGVVDSSNVTVTQGAVAAVIVGPEHDTLRTLDRSMQFRAVALDSTGAVLSGAKARWSSSDLSVATVDSTTGIATAERAGTARIMARVGQAWDSATLVVKQVAWILRVAPGLDTLTAIHDTGRVSATGIDSGGSAIPNFLITWTTNDSSIATVDQTGLVRAQATGLVLVTASSGNQSAFATIVVRQEIAAVRVSQDSAALTGAGDTVRLSAVAVDRNGFEVGGAAFTWRSNNGFVATVDTAGLVTAHFDGRTGIVATPAIGGPPDTATVSVTGAPSAALLIRTWTTGSQPDPDGYAAVLDGSTAHHVGTNDSVALTVIAGAHSVELTEFTSNCTVGDNPRSVDVPVGDTVRVEFAVTCPGPGDSLFITTTTTGADLDPDGYIVAVDEVCDEYGCYYLWTAPVGVNGTVAFAPIAPGTHTVALLDVAGNCSVAGANPRNVPTSPSLATHVTFSVTCVQTGSVRVTTATTGADLDPDGYEVWVGGVRYPIGVNDTVTRGGLLPGDYAVSLEGTTLAGNCTLGGPGAVTVTVTGGATVDVAFALTCAPLAAIRATVTTTGTDPDPDGYLVRTVGPGGVGGRYVPSNGTVVVPRLLGGTYTVTLEEIAVNCTVTGLGQLTVSVAAGDTADVAFDVDCAAAELLAVAMPLNGNTDVYRVKANGTGLMRLTSHAAADAEPAWSASSGRIAFVSERDGNTEIYVMNADGSGRLRLTDNPGEDRHPAWSPDGLKLAFWSTRDGYAGEIYVMNADGSSPVRLTVNSAIDIDPAWSPDGLRIAFASNRDADTPLEIYMMNADGSGVTRITFSGGNRHPDWSPAGTKLVYSHAFCEYYYGCVGDLLVINADGSGEAALRTGEGYDPVWSADGRWIAFHRYDVFGIGNDVFGIREDGTGLVSMVPGAFQPAWRR